MQNFITDIQGHDFVQVSNIFQSDVSYLRLIMCICEVLICFQSGICIWVM